MLIAVGLADCGCLPSSRVKSVATRLIRERVSIGRRRLVTPTPEVLPALSFIAAIGKGRSHHVGTKRGASRSHLAVRGIWSEKRGRSPPNVGEVFGRENGRTASIDGRSLTSHEQHAVSGRPERLTTKRTEGAGSPVATLTLALTKIGIALFGLTRTKRAVTTVKRGQSVGRGSAATALGRHFVGSKHGLQRLPLCSGRGQSRGEGGRRRRVHRGSRNEAGGIRPKVGQVLVIGDFRPEKNEIAVSGGCLKS